MGTGSEDSGEVEDHEQEDDCDDEDGDRDGQSVLAAFVLRIVVVFGVAWHLGPFWCQLRSRRAMAIDPAAVAAAA